ncbi:DNA polymerase lambda-like isoform X1 [Ananas comosus]|uniref:DNA polymerase lambda n=1 Tax=Ananas comosus TaxID=4615 RepID=A0A6P5EMK9_ANACO|nr:DNA polymerase lambda-like isoform X1 [Ananas comosus]XP_020082593.1 DNA polymerase lambda-like isoform X1 [Ananas comosus]
MAPKKKKKKQRERPPSPDPSGIFHGMVVFLVARGVQSRRLQVWKQKLIQMGASIEETLSKRVTHVFAMSSHFLLQQVGREQLNRFRGSLLPYQWLENCLRSGEKVPEYPYTLRLDEADKSGEEPNESAEARDGDDDASPHIKKIKKSSADSVENRQGESRAAGHRDACKHVDEQATIEKGPSRLGSRSSSEAANSSISSPVGSDAETGLSEHPTSSLYSPPDLNKNITEIFGKLINIYRALGDDRRSFSYYKAIPVIEKLPFKIGSVDQVKHLPAIGKSLQDHIHEIVTTGKLSKLEHFENDEKVRTVSLFGEVWGIGPATALKLYEKGYRTLDDLKNEESLTNAQRIGLQFFDDIKKRIPRHEVKDMEMMLQKAAQDIQPGIIVVCGGSYRRGKSSCGDLDIVITHPDGESHKGFLRRYIQYLKGINFLREDLVISMHSTDGTDSGVDTYFGLCTYPGQELRHRIDFKVYPRNRYAFGLIAWTGNDVLNRRLRLLAESKGYRLDDTGLYLATQGSAGKRGTKAGTMVSCDTEKDVFDILGFPWLEPHERNL